MRVVVTGALGVLTGLAFTGALIAGLVTGGVTPVSQPHSATGAGAGASSGFVSPPPLLMTAPATP